MSQFFVPKGQSENIGDSTPIQPRQTYTSISPSLEQPKQSLPVSKPLEKKRENGEFLSGNPNGVPNQMNFFRQMKPRENRQAIRNKPTSELGVKGKKQNYGDDDRDSSPVLRNAIQKITNNTVQSDNHTNQMNSNTHINDINRGVHHVSPNVQNVAYQFSQMNQNKQTVYGEDLYDEFFNLDEDGYIQDDAPHQQQQQTRVQISNTISAKEVEKYHQSQNMQHHQMNQMNHDQQHRGRNNFLAMRSNSTTNSVNNERGFSGFGVHTTNACSPVSGNSFLTPNSSSNTNSNILVNQNNTSISHLQSNSTSQTVPSNQLQNTNQNNDQPQRKPFQFTRYEPSKQQLQSSTSQSTSPKPSFEIGVKKGMLGSHEKDGFLTSSNKATSFSFSSNQHSSTNQTVLNSSRGISNNTNQNNNNNNTNNLHNSSSGNNSFSFNTTTSNTPTTSSNLSSSVGSSTQQKERGGFTTTKPSKLKQSKDKSDSGQQKLFMLQKKSKKKDRNTEEILFTQYNKHIDSTVGLNLDKRRKYLTWKSKEGTPLVGIPHLQFNEFEDETFNSYGNNDILQRDFNIHMENDDFPIEFEPLQPLRSANIEIKITSQQIATYVMKK